MTRSTFTSVTIAELYAQWAETARLNRGAGSISLRAIDTARKTRPVRHLWAESKHDLWVWSGTKARRQRLIETLDLRAPDAAERLRRYVHEA